MLDSKKKKNKTKLHTMKKGFMKCMDWIKNQQLSKMGTEENKRTSYPAIA